MSVPHIPYAINILLCLAAVLVANYCFRVANPKARVLNRYLPISVAGIVLAIVNIFMRDPAASFWLFLASLALLGTAAYQIRILPEREDPVRR
ncbi:MAG: hypothetical protein BGO51_05730 [Rhodospirillales bacterium 69-11]|nr:hypothetical protein [Rhodospirillales bacterium]MBN8925129.1 hypothetical protein [Rhodospirillales bacterium]OJW27222.1 MAG: hypothetical protein BGO51_05730 [Rhodospirillales bacterium 69-11]